MEGRHPRPCGSGAGWRRGVPDAGTAGWGQGAAPPDAGTGPGGEGRGAAGLFAFRLGYWHRSASVPANCNNWPQSGEVLRVRLPVPVPPLTPVAAQHSDARGIPHKPGEPGMTGGLERRGQDGPDEDAPLFAASAALTERGFLRLRRLILRGELRVVLKEMDFSPLLSGRVGAYNKSVPLVGCWVMGDTRKPTAGLFISEHQM